MNLCCVSKSPSCCVLAAKCNSNGLPAICILALVWFSPSNWANNCVESYTCRTGLKLALAICSRHLRILSHAGNTWRHCHGPGSPVVRNLHNAQLLQAGKFYQGQGRQNLLQCWARMLDCDGALCQELEFQLFVMRLVVW